MGVFLIKKDIYKHIGGFSPYLRIKEDTEFNVRAETLKIENKIYEDFEVDHLKKYNLFSDYFQKPFHASKLKLVEPLIFGKTTTQIGIKLLMSWIFVPLMTLFLLPTYAPATFASEAIPVANKIQRI